MAAEKQTTDGRGHDGQRQSPTRGTLESDCAVFDVPPSATAAFGFNYHHANGGFVGMMDVSDEVQEDQKLELREDFCMQSNPAISSSVVLLSNALSPPNAVEYRPNAYAEPSFGLTAGMGSVGTEELETVVRRLHVEDGLDPVDDGNCDTMLHLAIKERRSLEEIRRLAAAAASVGMVDAVNIRCQTALHLAVIIDRPDVVLVLVSLGASLHRQEQLKGDTPVHLACRLNLNLCLCAIFDAWTQRAAEHPAKHDIKAVLHSWNYEGETCLHLAARLENKSIFYHLVFSLEADVNSTELKRGQSVLHEAVNRRDMDVVNVITSCASTDINLQTYDGLTALDMAVSRNWGDGQSALVRAGARTTDDVDLEESDDDIDYWSLMTDRRTARASSWQNF